MAARGRKLVSLGRRLPAGRYRRFLEGIGALALSLEKLLCERHFSAFISRGLLRPSKCKKVT